MFDEGPCVDMADGEGPCVDMVDDEGPCVDTVDDEGPCVDMVDGEGSCVDMVPGKATAWRISGAGWLLMDMSIQKNVYALKIRLRCAVNGSMIFVFHPLYVSLKLRPNLFVPA